MSDPKHVEETRARADTNVAAPGFATPTGPLGPTGRGVFDPERIIPTDSAGRKTYPMGTGLLDYFPDALAEVAHISYMGNQKHNPGQPLHWARGKSMDHADCIIRHFTERGTIYFEGGEAIRHSAQLAWRALALLQEELEKEHQLALPRGCSVTGR